LLPFLGDAASVSSDSFFPFSFFFFGVVFFGVVFLGEPFFAGDLDFLAGEADGDLEFLDGDLDLEFLEAGDLVFLAGDLVFFCRRFGFSGRGFGFRLGLLLGRSRSGTRSSQFFLLTAFYDLLELFADGFVGIGLNFLPLVIFLLLDGNFFARAKRRLDVIVDWVHVLLSRRFSLLGWLFLGNRRAPLPLGWRFWFGSLELVFELVEMCWIGIFVVYFLFSSCGSVQRFTCFLSFIYDVADGTSKGFLLFFLIVFVFFLLFFLFILLFFLLFIASLALSSFFFPLYSYLLNGLLLDFTLICFPTKTVYFL